LYFSPGPIEIGEWQKVAEELLAFHLFIREVTASKSSGDTGVDSASNRNEYQEYFLGIKVVGA
jgi:hypothetical protein